MPFKFRAQLVHKEKHPYSHTQKTLPKWSQQRAISDHSESLIYFLKYNAFSFVEKKKKKTGKKKDIVSYLQHTKISGLSDAEHS